MVYLVCDASEREFAVKTMNGSSPSVVKEIEREFAVKTMNGSSPSVVKEIEREVKLLKLLKHPNIMPALGFTKQQSP